MPGSISAGCLKGMHKLFAPIDGAPTSVDSSLKDKRGSRSVCCNKKASSIFLSRNTHKKYVLNVSQNNEMSRTQEFLTIFFKVPL